MVIDTKFEVGFPHDPTHGRSKDDSQENFGRLEHRHYDMRIMYTRVQVNLHPFSIPISALDEKALLQVVDYVD